MKETLASEYYVKLYRAKLAPLSRPHIIEQTSCVRPKKRGPFQNTRTSARFFFFASAFPPK